MLEKLTIDELHTHLRLCEKNLDYLNIKRSMNPTDKRIRENYDKSLTLRNMIYSEINNRISSFFEDESI